MSFTRLLNQLPSPEKGEDEGAYFKRVMSVTVGESLMELREACRMKYNQTAAKELFKRIVESEDMLAMREAIALLLKETYKL